MTRLEVPALLPGAPPDLALALAAAGPDGAAPTDALTPEERERMNGFGHAERRRGFALGRTAARGLLADRLGCRPSEVPLAVANDGALEVLGTRLRVSVAHAGRGAEARAVAAVATRGVGVDLERIGPRPPDLWCRLLRPDEADVLAALGGSAARGLTDEAQTLVWALKEAVLKGERTGLRAGARSVRLTLDEPGRARAEAAGAADWRLGWARRGAFWLAVAWQADAA